MEQRPLRLGDIVDDYCPRERRVTNHVIVALVGDAIRQTRCGTCDTEHVYKAARLPRRRAKDEDPQAGAEAPGQLISRSGPEAATSPPVMATAPAPEASRTPSGGAPPAQANGAASPPPPAEMEMTQEPGEHADDVWPAHRRLIRASLPRVEGEEKTPRPIPEFTMHQRQGRGGSSYRGDFFGNGNGNGNSRGDGSGAGSGSGSFRQGQPGGPRREPGGGGQPGPGGGGKRWRHRRRGRGGPKAI